MDGEKNRIFAKNNRGMRHKYFELDSESCFFPSVELADRDGLLAFGGDLSVERLIMAYANGIFPWYSEDEPILWWSLDPRLVIAPGEMKVSKSLRHTLRTSKFEVKIDNDFEGVMRKCALTPREGQDGTWILEEMIEAYVRLHRFGVAHSFETYFEGELVGGLYGVSLGKLFCGESMFHTMTDASKVAFWHLHDFLGNHGFELIDCQQETNHLVSLGAYTIPRREYLERVNELIQMPTLKGNWGDGTAEEYYLQLRNPDPIPLSYCFL